MNEAGRCVWGSVVGPPVMASQHVHFLIPETCAYLTLYGNMNFAGVSNSRIWK